MIQPIKILDLTFHFYGTFAKKLFQLRLIVSKRNILMNTISTLTERTGLPLVLPTWPMRILKTSS